jgi:protein-S-isoprenylcysteine O-methyltransferase Ste14
MRRVRRVPVFERAAPASTTWNVAKTAAQVAVFWSLFLYVIPQGLVALERRLGFSAFDFPPDAAWVIFLLASVIGLSSGFAMATHGQGTPLPWDAPRRLVVRGPYRYVRNPMAIAGLTQGACVAALLGSWLSLGLVAAGFVVWNFGVRPLEERDLDAQFGDDYRRYCLAVRCWIPRVRAYDASA